MWHIKLYDNNDDASFLLIAWKYNHEIGKKELLLKYALVVVETH